MVLLIMVSKLGMPLTKLTYMYDIYEIDINMVSNFHTR